MISSIIVEDEPKVKESLIYLLGKYCPDITVCGTASSFEEGYNMVTQKRPHLVFVDIQLNSPEGTGIDLMHALDTEAICVIFISGWKDFAVEAFRVKAIDYLLKPINIRQLVEAVNKARERIAAKEKNAGRVNGNGTTTFHIPTQHGFIIVNQDEIIRCQAEGPYTHFFVKDRHGRITSSVNLGQIESKLRRDHFFRIHKSHIVNRRHIIEYKRGEGGLARTCDMFDAPVSRNKKDDFLVWLG